MRDSGPAPGSLRGRLIALTRPRGGEDALREGLLELGGEVLEAPAIEFAPPSSFDDLDLALRSLDGASWLAFASATAVERTIARAVHIGIEPALLGRSRLAAVGSATARRLALLLRAPDLVPARATGEHLARALAEAAGDDRVLVPRAEEGRAELIDGLSRAGVKVSAPAAYRTVPAPRQSLEPLAEALERGTVDAVVFASPSAVKSAVAQLGVRMLAHTTLAAIGPTTAAELRAQGLAVAIQPARYSGRALAEALALHFGPCSG
ncbi:MAG TPA: uroporphyrinogen-III synthase [Anaeromyxobacteraceae bacterium]|nr:uroporphyrinogen-III synthase [Anaeromyxobacteraceae bacterium]